MLRKFLCEHQVSTVTEQGWSGVKNGKLLELASATFDCFVTVDKNLSFQQNLHELPIPVIVLHARSNKLEHLKPLLPGLRNLLSSNLHKSVTNLAE